MKAATLYGAAGVALLVACGIGVWSAGRDQPGACIDVSGRYLLDSISRVDHPAAPPRFPRCKFLDLLYDRNLSESDLCLLPAVMEIKQAACERIEYWWLSPRSRQRGGELLVEESDSNWLLVDVGEFRRDSCRENPGGCSRTEAEIRIGRSSSGELQIWQLVTVEDGGWRSLFAIPETDSLFSIAGIP